MIELKISVLYVNRRNLKFLKIVSYHDSRMPFSVTIFLILILFISPGVTNRAMTSYPSSSNYFSIKNAVNIGYYIDKKKFPVGYRNIILHIFWLVIISTKHLGIKLLEVIIFNLLKLIILIFLG